MSLVELSPTAKYPDRAPEPQVPANVKPIVVDNEFTDKANLKRYIEGMPITTNYYQMVNDGVMGTYGYDPLKSPLLQQYIRVNGLELRLDGDILPTQNVKDQTFTIKGTAYVTAGVIPAEGDLFSYDVGDGRHGIFQINQQTRMTAMNNTVYQVEFQLIFYTSDKRFNDLETKVIEEMFFLKDFEQFGKSAVVTTETFDTLKYLYKAQHDMARDYIREFKSNEHHFLAVPGQPSSTYDPFVAAAFRGLIDPTRFPEIDRVNTYSFSADEFQSLYTIWDVILERRKELLVGVREKSMAANVGTFAPMPMSFSMRYCGATVLVMPGSDTEVYSSITNFGNMWTPGEGKMPGGPEFLKAPNNIVGLANTIPMLHPVSKDGYYVLSKAFYNKEPEGFSLLEKLLWDYLDNRFVNIDHLRHIATNYRAWPSVRRFYYVPLVMILIQISLQNAGPAVYGNTKLRLETK